MEQGCPVKRDADRGGRGFRRAAAVERLASDGRIRSRGALISRFRSQKNVELLRVRVNLSRVFRAGMAIVLVSCPASEALGAFVPWPQPSGTVAGLYSWSNGGSDNGLYGGAVFDAGGISFPRGFFFASSSNGVSASAADRLSVSLDFFGLPVEGFQVSAIEGGYDIRDGGSTSADRFFFVTNLDAPISVPGNPMLRSGSFARNLLDPPQSEIGVFTIPSHGLPAQGGRRFQVVLDTILQAQSLTSGSAAVDLLAEPLRIDFVVPEPVSAVVAMPPLLLRRRRSA